MSSVQVSGDVVECSSEKEIRVLGFIRGPGGEGRV